MQTFVKWYTNFADIMPTNIIITFMLRCGIVIFQRLAKIARGVENNSALRVVSLVGNML